jgi:hypothetical protein
MQKKYNPQLLTLVVGFALVLALVAGPILNEHPSPRLKIVLIGAAGLTLLAGFLINARRRSVQREQGRSADDEFTELARLNAGHAAFMMSMVLWLAIFAVQNHFDSTRTMLGVGILGQCGFYGICLAFFNRSGSLHED